MINAGSATLKYALFEGDAVLAEGVMEGGDVHALLDTLPQTLRQDYGVDEFDAVGHRIAHGGISLHDPCLIDDQVINGIEGCFSLAPLHNPPNLNGVRMAMRLWPKAAHVAVFDTAFHQTIPPRAYTYAIPVAWQEAGARRYGFHGMSHRYIALRAAQEMGSSTIKLISCHLGSGASLCAIKDGKSVDTSMGMSALGGLVMGTRCGDIDPGLFGFLERRFGLGVSEIEDILYRKSGLQTLAGSRDMRVLQEREEQGDMEARFAMDVYAYRIRHYIGAYAALMGGVDVLSFTGGVGENAAIIRAAVCENLGFMGIDVDVVKNANLKLSGSAVQQIQADKGAVKIMVMRTREEWMIAQDVRALLAA